MTVARSFSALAALVATVLAGGARPAAPDVHEPRSRLVSASDARAQSSRVTEWCGTPAEGDRTPNALAGHPVRWVYATPADGEDRLSSVAGLMQADAEAIDAWWRREDPTRTPRNDLALFPCGLQLDLSTLRLPQRGAELQGSARFGAVLDALGGTGSASEFTKVVVYYDGPTTDARTCGQGGGSRSGFGLAVVYLRACPGVSTAAVAAHELLHALGAVPFGAPNRCEGSHACDSELDLMYPSIDSSPLETRFLDVGRDDYYGHGGPWPDARAAPWLVHLDAQAQLTVSVEGPGRVSSDVPGLECSRPCTTTWNRDTRLTLRATPAPGAKLVRWGGACARAATCSISVGDGSTVSALFAPARFRLVVSVGGQGAVASARPGISCRPRCRASLPSYVPVRLRAKPASGWRLATWSGACRGSRPICSVPMTGATTVRATFVRARR